MTRQHDGRHPLDLSGRHYMVTGASSGVGRSTAQLLHRLGATLSLIDRDADGLERVRAELDGDRVHHYPADIADPLSADALVGRCVEGGGALHGLVHCAGVQAVTPVRALRPDGWRRMFAVNAEAGLALAKAFAQKKVYAGTDGAVVFISSVMATAGSAGAVAYSMSKAAVEGMSRSLAVELAGRAIRVNCIAPGFVKTPMFSRTEQMWDEAQRLSVERQHPLGFGEPEDIANAVAFLLADTGRWITGTVLVVDGGYLAQ